MSAAINARTPEGRQFAGLGQGSRLAFPQGVLDGITRIQIEADCLINEHTCCPLACPEPMSAAVSR